MLAAMDTNNKPATLNDLDTFGSEEIPRRPSLVSSGDEARFVVSGADQHFDIKLQLPERLVRAVADYYHHGEMPEPRTALRFDFLADTLSIFPQITYFSQRLYEQKYDQLREIKIGMNYTRGFPSNHDDIVAMLEGLPSAFIRAPEYGLGFIKEMKPLVKAVEKV
jgi:hypothetical protein